MEGSEEKSVKPSPWKQIPKYNPQGILFQDLMNESAQRKKEKQISGMAFGATVMCRKISR